MSETAGRGPLWRRVAAETFGVGQHDRLCPHYAENAALRRRVAELEQQVHRLQADAVQDTLTMPRTRSSAEEALLRPTTFRKNTGW